MRDIDSEIEAARRAAGLFDFSAHGKIRVTGGDRLDFLQAMVTSDIARLPVSESQPSLLVTAKGKLVADLLILRRPEDIWIETPYDRKTVARETLHKFVIAEDVEVVDQSDEWAILSLHGPLAGHVLSHACAGFDPIPARDFHLVELDQLEGRVLVLRNDRLGLMAFDIWVAADAADLLRDRILECGDAHGVRACGPEAREALRIAAGRPAWGREIDDDSFPGEVGLGGAVSSDKGCYVGQEVLARIRFQGHVRRRLAQVELEAMPEATLPIPLYREGREVGRLTSAATLPGETRALGLAIVAVDGAEPGATCELHSASDATGRAVVRAILS